ncbi:phosphoribosylanthranilate isomerase [Thermanaeromonas sp. C210]|uniref:phosphoribosylanthranilate isomerase n=1 Tax=Thermanaeromonas sp. C210 TaxID=2731925 RepID=UPI00155B968C|nr:phosphoribosylanthranilate isomerase [Thermanaeromonas sp. C210]GFN23456.1 N-(5'-phosphoribosyl)anthranilate isomerase [Thermanaeromonas sp. C210]
MVRVKICGIKTWEDARSALDAGAHVLGFVFAPSPRRIHPERAREIITRLPPFVTTVGVFVNEPRYSLLEIASFCRLDVLQLHGDEPPEYCRGLFHRLIKAIRVKDIGSLDLIPKYRVDAFLLDAFVPGQAGGTGHTFNWEIARRAKELGSPIILAGGLTPENVAEAIRQVRPYAVDVSSGVETNGQKDPVKIARFMEAVAGA